MLALFTSGCLIKSDSPINKLVGSDNFHPALQRDIERDLLFNIGFRGDNCEY